MTNCCYCNKYCKVHSKVHLECTSCNVLFLLYPHTNSVQLISFKRFLNKEYELAIDLNNNITTLYYWIRRDIYDDPPHIQRGIVVSLPHIIKVKPTNVISKIKNLLTFR